MTDALSVTDKIFYGHNDGLDEKKTADTVLRGLSDADDGDLFLERTETSGLWWEDEGRKIFSANSLSEGMGLRYITGSSVSFASAKLRQDELDAAMTTVRAIRTQPVGTIWTPPPARIVTPQQAGRLLYGSASPLNDYTTQQKIDFMREADHFMRSMDSRVKNVIINLSTAFQAVQVLRSDGLKAADLRPMSRMTFTVFTEQNGRTESGNVSLGGRYGLSSLFDEAIWKDAAKTAVDQAVVNLDSIDIDPGVMTVVLGSGWPGVLLHEAVGHGLEADFNRRKTSVFTNRIGQRVAARGVTVVDDGTIPNARGSINIDDEGTPSQRNVLIEDGILRAYMSDRLNARLMGMPSSGNGRRQDYGSPTIPRMTNTFMLAGSEDPKSIIASVDHGLYATHFNGGQVDITTGKFVFGMSEAYLIEDGKITAPVSAATLIGAGDAVLGRISRIGNDSALGGAGTCGKDGQSVPVGIGMPTVRIDGITVGGRGRKAPAP